MSSVGIYDRLAKVVLAIVLHRSKFQPSLVSQHLDDCCAASPAGDTSIFDFDNEYKAVAQELNILLASREDPEKSFAPSKEGCVYGINYNTTQQTWWLSDDRIARIQAQIIEILESDEVPQQKIWSLAGKIIHIKDIMMAGKFHIFYLLRANAENKDKSNANAPVKISGNLKREMRWWFTMIAMSGRRTRYPDPDACLPSWALTGYTDAAGGTKLILGSRCGAVLEDWWIYIPWSRSVNGDKTRDSGRPSG